MIQFRNNRLHHHDAGRNRTECDHVQQMTMLPFLRAKMTWWERESIRKSLDAPEIAFVLAQSEACDFH